MDISIREFQKRFNATMKSIEFLIRGKSIADDVQVLVSAIHDHFDFNDKTINVKISDRRSLSANAQIHVWCKQISDHTGEDVKTVFNRIKRDHGLPIILSDPEHGPVTDYILSKTNFWSMPDDKQLIMIGAMEVTRKLSTGQHKILRDNVQQFYNQHGINLTYTTN